MQQFTGTDYLKTDMANSFDPAGAPIDYAEPFPADAEGVSDFSTEAAVEADTESLINCKGIPMKIKTSELTGIALDWAVAKAEGDTYDTKDWLTQGWLSLNGSSKSLPMYSTAWEFGGPIIEREINKLFRNVGGTFSAQIRHEEDHPLAGWTNASGPTPLIAAMRCYVSAKLGDEIDVPAELQD